MKNRFKFPKVVYLNDISSQFLVTSCGGDGIVKFLSYCPTIFSFSITRVIPIKDVHKSRGKMFHFVNVL